MTVTNRDVMISDSERSPPKCSHPYVEILLIRQRPYNEKKHYCISIQVSGQRGRVSRRQRNDLLVRLRLSGRSNYVVQLHQPSVEGKQLFVHGFPHNPADSAVLHVNLSVIGGGCENSCAL